MKTFARSVCVSLIVGLAGSASALPMVMQASGPSGIEIPYVEHWMCRVETSGRTQFMKVYAPTREEAEAIALKYADMPGGKAVCGKIIPA